VDVELSTSTGKIEDIQTDKSPLHPTVSQNPPTITVARMLPGDRTNISVMTLSNSSEPALNVSAQSDEAVATEQKPDEKLATENSLMFAGAALSAGSVASMSVIFFILVRRRGLRVLRSGKPDIITFIAGVSGVVPMNETILMTEHNISYARLADIFLIGGLEGPGDRRDKCIVGLQSLLMLKNVASGSIARMRQNLSALGVEYKNADFDNLRKNARDEEDLTTRQIIIEKFSYFEAVKREAKIVQEERRRSTL
jgi:hypothetical protein